MVGDCWWAIEANYAHKHNIYMVSAGIIERKLRRTKVRLFTVPCCSIILFSSEGMKKNVSDLPPNFFRRSIILVGALLFYNSVFPHFSHISHFRSIINFPRAPFYN